MLVNTRTAEMAPEGYDVEGDAILQSFDDGSLKLLLTEDFDTDAGPDVRLFLSPDRTLSNAVELADLSGLDHFQGELTLDVPDTISLERYDFILMYCVQFNAFWASGEFGVVKPVGGVDFECRESTTSAPGGVDLLNVCPTDGSADPVRLSNNLAATPGTNYAYLLTDAAENLVAVVTDSVFNFEGSGPDANRIYGISFDGTLNALVGADRMQTTATGCFAHSSATDFLTVTKNACTPDYACGENATATTNWATTVAICPTDGAADSVEMRNNLFIAPGAHYAYLITDAEQTVLAVTTDSVYNFEGGGPAETRVYGINYDGELNAVIGANRTQTTATGCFVHSSADLYLTVTKNACPEPFTCEESLVATYNWVTDIELCTNDGAPDTVFLQNNIGVAPGDHYAFLLTDTNEIVKAVFTDSLYYPEGSGTDPERIYGMSYDGELMPAVGLDRGFTTASGCAIHSGEDIFITLNKTATCATSTVDAALSGRVTIFPNPVSDLLTVTFPAGFRAERLSVVTPLGRTVKMTTVLPGAARIRLSLTGMPAGHYVLLLEGEGVAVRKKVVVR